ncbi:MAG: hypothetical protein LBQ97_09635 [Fusobacteriaceae bacterium]|nr:hypothetical protein [Fusobacteriaceae bacterium]
MFYSMIAILDSFFKQYSYNSFEEMVIADNFITIRNYFRPFVTPFKEVVFANDSSLLLKYNSTANIEFSSLFHHICPKYFRKFSPIVLLNISNNTILKKPEKVRGMWLSTKNTDYSFGTMMSKESYDEILALILAQRAKWEKEHPEVGTQPEISL